MIANDFTQRRPLLASVIYTERTKPIVQSASMVQRMALALGSFVRPPDFLKASDHTCQCPRKDCNNSWSPRSIGFGACKTLRRFRLRTGPVCIAFNQAAEIAAYLKAIPMIGLRFELR